jgi:hypothetical protein
MGGRVVFRARSIRGTPSGRRCPVDPGQCAAPGGLPYWSGPWIGGPPCSDRAARARVVIARAWCQTGGRTRHGYCGCTAARGREELTIVTRSGRALGVATVALLACAWAHAAGAEVTIITSPEHAAGSLDRTFVQAAFTMRVRRWPDGTPVRVFVLPDADEVHARFSREQLGTYPYVLRDIWDRLVYTGTGFAPTVVATEAEMRRRVRATPGAIGYARETEGRPPPARVVPVRQEKRP